MVPTEIDRSFVIDMCVVTILLLFIEANFTQSLTQALVCFFFFNICLEISVMFVALPQLAPDLERHAASDSAHLQEEPAPRRGSQVA